MTPQQYDERIRDLVAFMVWMESRTSCSAAAPVWVLFALTILVFMTYFLYKSY
jgi:cytochrome c1